MYYGERVMTERKRLKITQKEMAKVLDVTSSTISIKENDVRSFRVIEIYKLYRELGLEIGFGKQFDFIYSEQIDFYIYKAKKENVGVIGTNFFGLSQREVELIRKREYGRMTFETLERMNALIKYVNEPIEMNIRNKLNLMCDKQEKELLQKLVNQHVERYGVQSTIRLLEADLKLDLCNFLRKLSENL